MKPKAPSVGAGPPPREKPARPSARNRKLRAVLCHGLSLSPAELRDSFWPGYAETYRTEQITSLQEPKAAYGNRRAR
jgi:hypothetical protein